MTHSTPRRMRRAAINRTLLIALVVVFVIAAGYWFIKWSNRPSLPAQPEGAQERMFGLVCSACGKSSELPRSEIMKLERGPDDAFKCPKCGQLTARRNRPGADAMVPP